MGKKGQVGIEYMIIVGFVTFAIILVLAAAYFYSDQIKDQIKMNQVENFGIQLINSAESVFFAGEPSKATVKYYLPEGVQSVSIDSDYLVITVHLSSGDSTRTFKSDVPISGTITPSPGIKKLTLEATADDLEVS